MKETRSLRIDETGDRYTVSHGGEGNSVPSIRLRGKWLRQAGFVAGQDVTIDISPGRLVIMASEDEGEQQEGNEGNEKVK